jgi:hypothetical protein
MIPFSMDRESFGSEAAVQILVVTGSSSILIMEMCSFASILSSTSLSYHYFSNWDLYLDVNGPAYATIPAATRELPIRRP